MFDGKDIINEIKAYNHLNYIYNIIHFFFLGEDVV